MKFFFTLCTALFLGVTINAQQVTFCDDFEGYQNGDPIAQTSSDWETWGSIVGGNPPYTDDANVSITQSTSGNNSLYLFSGPSQGSQDVVLPFGSGAPYISGDFEFVSKFYVNPNTGAYFNFQAEVTPGTTWSLDVKMDLGTIVLENTGSGINYLTSTYPEGQWFELKVACDLTNNLWELFINGVSQGSFTNTVNKIASLDLYPIIGHEFYVDDVCYSYTPYIALAYDMSAIDLDFSSFIALSSAPFTVSGEIVNYSSTTITSLDINYSINGAAPIVDNLIGQNLVLFDILNFNHSINWTPPSIGTYVIEVWASNLNGNIDLNTANDTLSQIITVLTSIPEKITVGEEKTGSWCGWCPRGAVALGEMEATSNFIGIAVHNGDPMVISSYDGSLGNYIPGGYPGGGVDRVLIGDPSDFSIMHASRVDETVPCGVNSINAYFDGITNKISVSAEVETFGEMSGNFRLSCVIVEDDLESTSSGWAQTNSYSGGGSGVMAFPSNINGGYNFSVGANPAQSSDFGGYDHVARSLSNNDILGNVGSLPSGTVTAGIYNYTFTDVDITSLAAYSDAGFNWTKAHAVVMIINATTGEILNAQEVALTSINVASSWDCDAVNGCSDPLSGNGQYSSLAACTAVCNSTSIQENNTSEFNIYPNPVKNILTIGGDYSSADIYDVFGKLVLTSKTQKIINVSTLSNGVYFVNINTKNTSTVKKITITK